MELNEFVAHFAEQFEETDASVFTPETKYHDLEEWSSLIGLSVIAMVDDEYDVTLKGNDVKNSVTIEDLFNIVKERAKWHICTIAMSALRALLQVFQSEL